MRKTLLPLALFVGLTLWAAAPATRADSAKSSGFFNGKDLDGWEGLMQYWSVQDGAIVGRTEKDPGHNTFLCSKRKYKDFELSFEIRLKNGIGNSGVQIRSRIADPVKFTVAGPQADIGKGWWGKLYEENARGILSDRSGEPFLKRNDWNDYEIIAVGSRVKTFLNGKACADLDDPAMSRRGIFALQIHSGPPMEVRFKELHLELLPADARVGR